MFKYKSTPIVLIILLSLFSIFIFFTYRFGAKETVKNNDLMKNNIVFSGIITNLNISNNHAFGIMTLKITETNNHLFKSSKGNEIYPYSINDSVAEVYHFIPLEIKKGYKAVVNSNDKIISIYDGNKFLYEWEISIVSSDIDIEFVKQHTIMK